MIEGAKKEGVISYWTSTFPNPEQVFKPFYDKYPFLEVKLWDARSPEMVARMIQEAKAGRFSVDVISLAEKDFFDPSLWKELIAEYEWPNTKNWTFQRGHNYYRNIGASAMGSAYNTTLLAPAEAPRSLEDLNSTKWRGKAALSTSSNDAPLYYAYVWGGEGKLNWDKSFNFWREVVGNARPRTLTGHTGGVAMLAAGEFPLFIMTSLSVVTEFVTKGALLDVALAPTAKVTPHAMAVAKNAPHPNAARLFVDYLTSYEGQIIYSNARISLAMNPEAARRARGNLQLGKLGIALDEIPPQFATAENLKKSNDFWVGLLGRPN